MCRDRHGVRDPGRGCDPPSTIRVGSPARPTSLRRRLVTPADGRCRARRELSRCSSTSPCGRRRAWFRRPHGAHRNWPGRQPAGILHDMSDAGHSPRSAVVFGARNLGRAAIELLVAEGWAVTGVARSEETLAGVTAAGALAVRGDVTDQASVRAVLEQAAAAHGSRRPRLQRRGSLRRRPQRPLRRRADRRRPPEAFDSWAAAPARSAFAFLSAHRCASCSSRGRRRP